MKKVYFLGTSDGWSAVEMGVGVFDGSPVEYVTCTDKTVTIEKTQTEE